jgi:glycoprotein-N-acetylgalactosamine 3-beta-galactosyltransferase
MTRDYPSNINNSSKDVIDKGYNISPSNTPRYLVKMIQPGNHTNIPSPETRIGPNGERGYIHDPQFLQKKKILFHIPNEYRENICVPAGKGDELPEGAFNLKRIRNYMESSRENRDVKLFCAIYTHSNAVHQTDAISETWGPRCDGLLFAGNKSSIENGHMHLPSNSRKKFGYKGLVQRTRTILAYLYDNFLNDYDFFHLSGDDTYLIVDNLKEFLASEKVREWDEKPDQYLMAGYWMHWGDMKDGYFYLGGGSGYTLSRKALKAYVEGPLQKCIHVFKDYSSKEDMIFTDCARDLTTKFIDTRDSLGAHRYHQMPVQRHSTFPHASRTWGFSMRLINQTLLHMNQQFGFPLVYNVDYISKSSVAFHKHSAAEIRRLELLLYKDGVAECGSAFVDKDTPINQE